MKKFEYRLLEVPTGGFWGGAVDGQDLVDKLNELGEEGWELTSSFTTAMWEGQSHGAIIVLKRERPVLD